MLVIFESYPKGNFNSTYFWQNFLHPEILKYIK